MEIPHDNLVLQTKKIIKNYPGVRALNDVDFDLKEGEVHCLVGKNGAGKSTLIEILAGSIKPDGGIIEVFGEDYNQLNPTKSIALGIETIHQENFLAQDMTVAENIFLGNLKKNKAGFFSMRKCIKDAKEIFSSLDVSINPSVLVSTLTPVEKKVISIAKAFSENLKVLILDEPTAALDEEVENKLFKTVKNLLSKGISIIYISHNLDEIFLLGDRVTVLRDGKKIATHFIKEVDEKKLISDMIGEEKAEMTREKSTAIFEGELEVKNYSRRGVIKDVSFKVKRGEIFGIGGLVGSGRTELVSMVFGIDKKDSGKLILNGKDITPKNPVDAINKGLGFLAEDRKTNSLMLYRPIYENISVVDLIKRSGAFLKLQKERKSVQDISDKLNIVAPSINQLVVKLSGGNQQKVVFGKWLIANSDILILDEPTVGIDIGAKEEIYSLINGLAKQGKIIIMISSDTPELASMCNRVGVMRAGKMIKILEKDEVSEENILKYSIGSQS
ncbi:MAG: sugar ABC transporter ATP-binding protein [Actinobacteria bacterium]|nr:sugar ABC transporter ATP-binding protein [Actinomycetota bacterium]